MNTNHPMLQELKEAFRTIEHVPDDARFMVLFRPIVHDWLRWQALREVLPTVDFETLQGRADKRIAGVIGSDLEETAS